MAELEKDRHQQSARPTSSFSDLMEIIGDLEEGSRQLTESYEAHSIGVEINSTMLYVTDTRPLITHDGFLQDHQFVQTVW